MVLTESSTVTFSERLIKVVLQEQAQCISRHILANPLPFEKHTTTVLLTTVVASPQFLCSIESRPSPAQSTECPQIIGSRAVTPRSGPR